MCINYQQQQRNNLLGIQLPNQQNNWNFILKCDKSVFNDSLIEYRKQYHFQKTVLLPSHEIRHNAAPDYIIVYIRLSYELK